MHHVLNYLKSQYHTVERHYRMSNTSRPGMSQSHQRRRWGGKVDGTAEVDGKAETCADRRELLDINIVTEHIEQGSEHVTHQSDDVIL